MSPLYTVVLFTINSQLNKFTVFGNVITIYGKEKFADTVLGRVLFVAHHSVTTICSYHNN